jgi:hypothetical protein
MFSVWLRFKPGMFRIGRSNAGNCKVILYLRRRKMLILRLFVKEDEFILLRLRIEGGQHYNNFFIIFFYISRQCL